MATSDVVERYVAAWNAHDANGIVACFVDGGTYEDPGTGGPLTGPDIGAYAGRLFAMMPDLTFEPGQVNVTGRGQAAFEWRMRGTNSGPRPGLPPSGKTVELAGVDVLEIADDRIVSLRGYFDRQSNFEQLGLAVTVQPDRIGPFSFGTAAHRAGPRGRAPGAVGLTWLQASSAANAETVNLYSRGIAESFGEQPGFIGFVGGQAGARQFTVSAWDDVDALTAAMRAPAHAQAMAAFWRDGLADFGFTSVWVPHRLNGMLIRCPACDTWNKGEDGDACQSCGAALPEPPGYW